MPPKNKGGRIKQKVKHSRAKHYKSEEEVKNEEEIQARDTQWKQRNLKMPTPENSDSEDKSDPDENNIIETEPSAQNDGANFIPGLDEDVEPGSSDEDRIVKAKGVSHLIEISNPNRGVDINITKKIEEIGDVKLSRKERESVEAERYKARMDRERAAGKTAESKRDLARLEQVKKEREEASRKKEMEKKAKEDRSQQKLANLKQQPM